MWKLFWQLTIVLLSILLLSTESLLAQPFSDNCSGGHNIVPICELDLCSDSKWVLVFEDNFDGDSLDLGKWRRNSYPGSLEGGTHQNVVVLRNAVIEDTVVSLYACKERVQELVITWKDPSEILSDGLPNLRWFDYTACLILSKQKFSYGYFEASCKIPDGKGIWPAMWQFGDYIDEYNTKHSQEIDMFEFWDDKPKLLRTDVHHDGIACPDKHRGVDYSKDYHTYGLLWEPWAIEWYVDGELIRRHYRYSQNGAGAGCRLNAWQLYQEALFPKDSLNLYFNIAVDNRSGMKPDNSTTFPKKMQIDWVRYYSRQDILDQEAKSFFYTQVYPNPNSGIFDVEIRTGEDDKLLLRVFTIDRSMLFSEKMESTGGTFNLSFLNAGVYFVEIENQTSKRRNYHRLLIVK